MKRGFWAGIAVFSISLTGCSNQVDSEYLQQIGLSKEAADNAAYILRTKQPGPCYDLMSQKMATDNTPIDYLKKADDACSNAALGKAEANGK